MKVVNRGKRAYAPAKGGPRADSGEGMRIMERLRGRKLFQPSLSPEVLARLQMQGETKLQAGKIEVKHFQFVAILVDESNSQEIPAIISMVVGTLVQHQAMISNIASSLLVGILGVPFPEGNSPVTRRRLVDALLKENGDRIRIAHGECDGAVGLLGNKERFSYGEVIPGFSEILKKLLDTKLGTAVEISRRLGRVVCGLRG